MKAIRIISIGLIIIQLQSCSLFERNKTDQAKNIKNDLFFDEVIVHNDFAIIDDEQKPEWMENTGLRTDFLQTVIDTIKSGNFRFYEPDKIWNRFEEMDSGYFKKNPDYISIGKNIKKLERL